MEAETEERARELAQQALAKDPDCVDALLTIANLDARSPKEAIAALEKAVEAGERSLGAQFFAENKGRFWGLIETRPYMRAKAELAALHRSEGHVRKAIGHYEALLELNPNDNQGVRDELLGCYLTCADLDGAHRLLTQYKEDAMATFAWGRVLERYLAGDRTGARRALDKARKANRFVELYLSAAKPLPESTPEMYGMGSEEEAVLCVQNLLATWVKHRDALFWLLEQLHSSGPPHR
jgi:tetratricopeptide (TPR) repeat protein